MKWLSWFFSKLYLSNRKYSRIRLSSKQQHFKAVLNKYLQPNEIDRYNSFLEACFTHIQSVPSSVALSASNNSANEIDSTRRMERCDNQPRGWIFLVIQNIPIAYNICLYSYSLVVSANKIIELSNEPPPKGLVNFDTAKILLPYRTAYACLTISLAEVIQGICCR